MVLRGGVCGGEGSFFVEVKVKKSIFLTEELIENGQKMSKFVCGHLQTPPSLSRRNFFKF